VSLILWRSLRVELDVQYLPHTWYWKPSRVEGIYHLSIQEPHYYYHEVTEGSKEQEFLDLLVDKLDFGPLKWHSAVALVNYSLAVSCSNHRGNMINRMRQDPKMFLSRNWPNDPLRERVIQHFSDKKHLWLWNNTSAHEMCPVLPAVHATSIPIAQKIASAGFASLSLLDAGYYGKGIYFSTSALYTLPYFATKPSPAILICFVLPGNPYPVIESPKEKHSIVGSHIKAGFQSHYVLTGKSGFPLVEEDYQKGLRIYDEVVINQEGQVVPLFMLKIDTSNILEVQKHFERGARKKV